MDVEETTFQRALRIRREEEATKQAESLATRQQLEEFADCIPEPETVKSKNHEDLAVDAVLERVDIVDGYTRWCGKSVPKIRSGQTESIKISCPVPGHTDKHPSAWINTDKNTWYCGTCEVGGDIFDIAAYRFGYPVPSYKEGANFHRLRREMAESLGVTFTKRSGSTELFVEVPQSFIPAEEFVGDIEPSDRSTEPPESTAVSTSATESTFAPVVSIAPDTTSEDDEFAASLVYPPLDWQAFAKEGTWLHDWMKLVINDRYPAEYHFWYALVALGMAAGRDVVLDVDINVFSNLFVVMLGGTGSGKTLSRRFVDELFEATIGHSSKRSGPRTVRRFGEFASGEALIDAFVEPFYEDDIAKKQILGYLPVRGVVNYGELSAITGRSMRTGNTLKTTMMDFYDAKSLIATHSRTHGTKEAQDAFCSVVTTSQPLALKRLLSEEDAHSGFLNRWIFASAKPKLVTSFLKPLNIDVKPTFTEFMKIHGWAASGVQVALTEEAGIYGEEMFTHLSKVVAADDKEIIKRLEHTLKKLILLVAINQRDRVLDKVSIQRAFSLLDYLMASYGITATSIANTEAREVQEAIERAILTHTKRKSTAPTLRDINRLIARRKFSLDLTNRVLKTMIELGLLEVTVSQKGVGRPTERYKVVDCGD